MKCLAALTNSGFLDAFSISIISVSHCLFILTKMSLGYINLSAKGGAVLRAACCPDRALASLRSLSSPPQRQGGVRKGVPQDHSRKGELKRFRTVSQKRVMQN